MTRERLRPLTALRFVAALLVFFWHVPPTMPVAYAFSFGYAGVGFFFVLSGFILTYSYAARFDGTAPATAMRDFYLARAARIYPLVVVSTLIMLVVLSGVGGLYWGDQPPPARAQAVALQLALLQSWFPSTAIHFGINGPAWSLSVESFFYALFPFIMAGLMRWLRTVPLRRMLLVAGFVWLCFVALVGSIDAARDDWRLYVFPPARLAEFVAGMLLGVVFLRRERAGRRILQPTSTEILALAFAALMIALSPFVPLALRFSVWLLPSWLALILVFALGGGAISRLLAHGAAVRLGEISYAFYLTHLPVVALLRQTIGDRHPLIVPVSLSAALVLSFALHHGVEQPMRTRLRALFARPPRERVGRDPLALRGAS